MGTKNSLKIQRKPGIIFMRTATIILGLGVRVIGFPVTLLLCKHFHMLIIDSSSL